MPNKLSPRRLIGFRYDLPLDDLTEQAVTALIRLLPVGAAGMQFDGAHATGTIVNHRSSGVWTVSFRPAGGRRPDTYSTVAEAAKAVIAGP